MIKSEVKFLALFKVISKRLFSCYKTSGISFDLDNMLLDKGLQRNNLKKPIIAISPGIKSSDFAICADFWIGL